jgi:Holliday junction resolvasome RuvABC endonuclease subunit
MINEIKSKTETYVIALDLATTYGYSVFKISPPYGKIERVISGRIRLDAPPKKSHLKDKRMELCRRCQNLEAHLEEIIFEVPIDFQIVLVKEMGVAGMKVGGWTKTVQAAFDQSFFMTGFLNLDNLSIAEYSPASIKKWATGNGQLAKNKPAMIEAANQMCNNHSVLDDNEADAVCLGHLVASFISCCMMLGYNFETGDDEKFAKVFTKFRKLYTYDDPYVHGASDELINPTQLKLL